MGRGPSTAPAAPGPGQPTSRVGSPWLGLADLVVPVPFAVGGEKWAGVGVTSATNLGGGGGPSPLTAVEGMG